MTKLELVITEKNGKPYWTERFENKKDLDKWLAEEKTRPYWKKDFVVQVVDNTAAIEERDRQSKAEAEVQIEERRKLMAELKKLRKTPPSTVKECGAALALILQLLGVEPDAEARVK